MSENNKKTNTLQEYLNKGKELAKKVKDFLWAKRKIVLPVVLALCLVLTAWVGVSSHKNKKAEVQETTTELVEMPQDGSQIPDVPLEENAIPEINELMQQFYTAMAEGDTDTIQKIVEPVSDVYLIKIQEYSKYIDSYNEITVYTKPGPIDNSYLVFASTQVQMSGYEQTSVPGLVTYYVCQRADGTYYINMEENMDDDVAEYIKAIDKQDDVIDLNNKISVAFNELLAADEDFASYYVAANNQIKAAVKEAKEALDEQLGIVSEEAEEEETEEVVETIKKVKATDVVNMRSSDSEKADKLGKAQVGDTFTLLEEKPNGWSKVDFNGKEVFIKSDYLEVVSETPVAGAEAEEERPVITSLGTDGYVKPTTTVNIRKSPSETAEKLGKASAGEKLELITAEVDGWCKVKYKGKTGYVKTEFVK